MIVFAKTIGEEITLAWYEALGCFLLPKLLSGELRVLDAERIIKESVL